MVYYDLEAKNESIKGTGYKRIQWSVHYSKINEGQLK